MIESLGWSARLGQTAAGCALMGWVIFHGIADLTDRAHHQRRVAIGLVLFFMLCGMLSLAVQSVMASGSEAALLDLAAWRTLLQGTLYGKVWLARQVVMLIALVALWLNRPRTAATNFAGMCAALAMALSALGGHASTSEWGGLVTACQALHLVALGAWWGGLLPLSRVPRGQGLAAFAAILRRFSRLATLCMAIILLTGIVLAWAQVGSLPPLFGTVYGQLLLSKLALVAAVLGLAAWLRWRFMARLDRLTANTIVNAIPRWIVTEWLVALGILAIATVMSSTPPARHDQVLWPFDFRIAPPATWAQKNIPLIIPAYPDSYRVSAVPYHAVSISEGAALFKAHCTSCHGVGGLGDGPQARALPKPPADLSAPHTADHTAGDMFWWLTHGIPAGGMPAFAPALDEEARWDLINYLRTFSNGYQARILRPQIARSQPWLGAPDFNYLTPSGLSGSMKAFRGENAVWLVFFSWPESRARLAQLTQALPALRASGTALVVIPLGPLPLAAVREIEVPVSIQGAEETVATYMLLRRTLGNLDAGDRAPLPSHMEMLVDRFGYVRARWLPAESTDWQALDVVLAQLKALAQEPEILPPPDEHLH